MSVLKNIKSLFKADPKIDSIAAELEKLKEWREKYESNPNHNRANQYLHPEFEAEVRAGTAKVGHTTGGNTDYGPTVQVSATCASCRFLKEHNSITWGTGQEEQRTHTKVCTHPQGKPDHIKTYETPVWCPYIFTYVHDLVMTHYS